MKVRIHYLKLTPNPSPEIINIKCFGLTESKNIKATHIIVHSYNLEEDIDIELDPRNYLNYLFRTFNDSESNPLVSEERQKFIKENWLHTSFSTGDVVEIKFEFYREFWSLGLKGWIKIE